MGTKCVPGQNLKNSHAVGKEKADFENHDGKVHVRTNDGERNYKFA